MSTTNKEGRIPRQIPKFDQYFRAIVSFLTAGPTPNNGTRLGLTAAEEAQLTALYTQWFTGNQAAPGLIELHGNSLTKNKATAIGVEKFMRDFGVFFRPLLNRMAVSPVITSSDRVALHIAEPNLNRTLHQVPISETVFFEAKSLGGGQFKFSCRTTKDSRRCSKPKGADSVELSIKIGDPAPTNGDDPSTRKETSSHAQFILSLGGANAGLKAYLYARWINSKHQQLAGPWNAMTVVIVG